MCMQRVRGDGNLLGSRFPFSMGGVECYMSRGRTGEGGADLE